MIATRRILLGTVPALAVGVAAGSQAMAASARQISSRADQALRHLYGLDPKSRELARRAVAILVFPRIYKGGLIVGGQTGDGALFVQGRPEAYYNISAASFGLQIGGQTFSYALFFINQSALDYLRKSDGWALGSGPSVVVLDKSAAASIDTTTLTQDVYAIPFGGRGLMAGLSLEGSKITRIHPGA
jgi:lipid-binding SYLF domain-containing protein